MILVREATQADNAGLLALTRESPMPGAIPLRIDREPDFFRLVRMRGEAIALVAEHEGAIVGCITASARYVFVAGRPERVHYVGDMKVAPDHRGKGVGAQLAGTLFRRLVAANADLLVCVVARGNRRVLTFLEGRFEIPRFQALGRFFVHQVLASRRPPRTPYQITAATEADLPEIAPLSRRFNRAYELAPVLCWEDWREELRRPDDANAVLVARKERAVRAVASVFDATWAKQHVVLGMPLGIALVAAPLRLLGCVWPPARLPASGEAVKMLFLRNLAVAPGHEEGLRALVQAARNRAGMASMPFLVVGLHERDPLREILRPFPKLTMGSEAFVTSLKGDSHLMGCVRSGIPVEDYALA